MTRILLPSVLLAIALALPASAAPAAVPLVNNDAGASSATNGESTLVAWTNMYSVYSNNWSVYIRLLDSPFDRNAIYVGPGQGSSVATNGRQFLVGYSLFLSRFNTSVSYDNVLVQLVSPEGVKLGAPKAINHSIFGRLKKVAWNGKHWLVSYQAGQLDTAHVAFLDESLNVVARLELGIGTLFALQEIDERWWAFYGDEVSTEAVELRPDATTGARFSTGPLSLTAFNEKLTHGTAPLVLMQDGDRVDAMPFDPFTGFGERRTFLEQTQLIDVKPFDGGSMLLVASSYLHYDTIFVNAAGELAPQLPLFEVETEHGSNKLGISKNGMLLFVTPRITVPDGVGDLFAYRVPPARAPIDPASGQLVSQVSVPVRRRSARH